MPGGARTATSASRRSPTHERAAVAQAVQRGEEELRLGLANRAARARRWPSRRPPRPAPVPATGRRASGRSRRGRAPHLGAAQRGLHRALQLGEVEALVAADHDDVGAIGDVGAVEDAQARVGDVAVHAASR
jgi:hypothetical protein